MPRARLYPLLTTLTATFLALLFAEGVLRLLGQRPIEGAPGGESWTIDPEDGFFVYSDRRGYAYGPGRFEVTLHDGYRFTITHDSTGLRRTALEAKQGPAIWIFGGSFSHGWSVNDADSFPWQLQERMLDHRIVNFGVGGYGTLLSWVQFQEAIAQRPRPQTVVIAYASFHDERNVWTRVWRRAIAPAPGKNGHPIPRAVWTPEGFTIEREIPTAEALPFAHRSALMALIEDKWGRIENRRTLHSQEVTERILLAFRDRCQELGIRLLVAGILDNDATQERLAFCENAGIETVDISVDLDAGLRNLPHDAHPGPRAHAIYAEKLATKLTSPW